MYVLWNRPASVTVQNMRHGFAYIFVRCLPLPCPPFHGRTRSLGLGNRGRGLGGVPAHDECRQAQKQGYLTEALPPTGKSVTIIANSGGYLSRDRLARLSHRSRGSGSAASSCPSTLVVRTIFVCLSRSGAAFRGKRCHLCRFTGQHRVLRWTVLRWVLRGRSRDEHLRLLCATPLQAPCTTSVLTRSDCQWPISH